MVLATFRYACGAIRARTKSWKVRGSHLRLSVRGPDLILVLQGDALDFLAHFVERQQPGAELEIHCVRGCLERAYNGIPGFRAHLCLPGHRARL